MMESSDLQASIVSKKHVIRVPRSILAGTCFFLRYDSGHDLYNVTNHESVHRSCGWQSMIYHAENITRRYIDYENMFDLTRIKECPSNKVAKLIWRFDLSEVVGRWSQLEIRVSAKIYPTSKVSAKLTNPNGGGGGGGGESTIKELKFNETQVISASCLDSKYQQINELNLEIQFEEENTGVLGRHLVCKIIEKLKPNNSLYYDTIKIPAEGEECGLSVKVLGKPDSLAEGQQKQVETRKEVQSPFGDPAGNIHQCKT